MLDSSSGALAALYDVISSVTSCKVHSSTMAVFLAGGEKSSASGCPLSEEEEDAAAVPVASFLCQINVESVLMIR